MLTKRNRFHGYGGLRYLYKNAEATRSRLMTVKYIVNPHRKTSRIAVVISKKVHKSAVGRNRMRRRIYEIIRHELPQINGIYDIAVIVTSGEILFISHEELTTTVRELFTQAGLYRDEI